MQSKNPKFQIIDNPGKGNCGYYAFLMGLIYLARTYQDLRPIEYWKAIDPTVTENLDLLCRLDIVSFKADPSVSDSLDALQMSLRRLRYKHIIDRTPEQYDQFIGETAYNDWYDLIQNYEQRCGRYAENSRDTKANALVNSLELRKWAKALHVKYLEISYPKYPRLQMIARDEFIFAALLKCKDLISNAYKEHYVKNASWATEQDLNDLSEMFQTEVIFHVNGKPSAYGNLSESPYIYLNNQLNAHWTLLIPHDEAGLKLEYAENRQMQINHKAVSLNPEALMQNVQSDFLPLPEITDIYGFEEFNRVYQHNLKVLQLNQDLDEESKANRRNEYQEQYQRYLDNVKTHFRREFENVLNHLDVTKALDVMPNHQRRENISPVKMRKKVKSSPYLSYGLNASFIGLFFGGVMVISAPELVMSTMTALAIPQVAAILFLLAASIFLTVMLTYVSLFLSDCLIKSNPIASV